MPDCKNYLITVWEHWDHGDKWSYKVRTNDIDALKGTLKERYDRFQIKELPDDRIQDHHTEGFVRCR